MGNASSTLTQYDIEEVQEHSNHLCGSSLHMDFLFCFVHFSRIWLGSDFWFFVVFGVKISFPARNSVVVQEILPTWPEFQGFYLSRWVFICTRVCDEPSFSGGPLDWFSDCQVWVFIVQFELFWFLHSPLFDFCCYMALWVSARGCLRWLMDWISRNLWRSCPLLALKLVCHRKSIVGFILLAVNLFSNIIAVSCYLHFVLGARMCPSSKLLLPGHSEMSIYLYLCLFLK